MVRLVLLPHHEAAKPKEVAMPQPNMPRSADVYGIDIGKNIFHVVGLGSDGVPVQKVRFRRDTLLQFFERAAPAIVGMESCAGSQWIARKIQALGHKVRLIAGIADAVLAAKLRNRRARFVLFENADNLFVRETVALHSLVLSMGQSLLQNGLFQRGKVTLALMAQNRQLRS
jgi:hypothetical protein